MYLQENDYRAIFLQYLDLSFLQALIILILLKFYAMLKYIYTTELKNLGARQLSDSDLFEFS